jgi:hypothetical protein
MIQCWNNFNAELQDYWQCRYSEEEFCHNKQLVCIEKTNMHDKLSNRRGYSKRSNIIFQLHNANTQMIEDLFKDRATNKQEISVHISQIEERVDANDLIKSYFGWT